MDRRYPPPIPPLSAYYPSGYPPMMPPEALQPRRHQLQTLSMESIGSYSDYDDPNRPMLPPQGPQRSRRRQAQSSEHVKHRRTRSGCYTCRQRRVKVSLGQKRCRKGKRECTYPGNTSSPSPSSSKPAKGSSKGKDSPGDSTPSGSEIDVDERIPLSAIPDEDEDDIDESEPASAISQNLTDLSSSTRDGNLSPFEDALARGSSRPQPVRSNSRQSIKSGFAQSGRWATLPKDVRYFLRYHRDNMSHHHYAFKYDGGEFLKTTFLEIAMNEGSAALLYAIVAFAAYHHSISRNDDNISLFLSYYNKSIAYLQHSLKNKRHNVATLLAILQLATIEEFLGDWLNLLGHQKAAYQILTDLFTPQTIMQDEIRRKIINWYIRFDLVAAMMAGNETVLDREWFAAAADFYRRQVRDRPNDLGARFEDFFATSRLLATDVTLLLAAKTKGNISDEQFQSRTQDLTSQFAEFEHTIETAFTDPSFFVKSFPRAPNAPNEGDLFDYRDPNFLYAGEFSTMNFVLLDHWAIDLMFKYQVAMITRQPLSPELTAIALKKCKMFEAIQYGEEGGPMAMLGSQASLGILALFLPKDQQHTAWCRRKFADIERLGYIYPATYRTRMTELWGEDVSRWWLPNEESYPSTIRTIREFVEYRATRPTDMWTTDIRNMKGMFRNLNIEEQGVSDELRNAGTDRSISPWVHGSSPEQPWT
ncbi:Adhesion and hyphal regulator 1 [Lecanosticta acicola]|uniref:Adhesion and hyphal regulator 1 n=1 Tax=Lecanosticta acicola TaxID=111012 RepID=A0AAI8Z3N3_9PEZI|nr:Adhesion and hyphal regulator 1 [Lecanosticta acicola]